MSQTSLQAGRGRARRRSVCKGRGSREAPRPPASNRAAVPTPCRSVLAAVAAARTNIDATRASGTSARRWRDRGGRQPRSSARARATTTPPSTRHRRQPQLTSMLLLGRAAKLKLRRCRRRGLLPGRSREAPSPPAAQGLRGRRPAAAAAARQSCRPPTLLLALQAPKFMALIVDGATLSAANFGNLGAHEISKTKA